MSNKQQTIVFNLQANVEQIKQSANEINNVFSKLNLPQNLQTSFSKTFNKLTEDIRNFEIHANKGFKTLSDTKKAEKNIETIVTDFEKLRFQVKDIKGFPADKLLPKDVLDRVKQYKDLLEKANKLTLKDNSSGINKAAEAVKKAEQEFSKNEQSIKKNNSAIKDNEDRYKELSQNIADAEKSLKGLVARREELKNKSKKTTDEAVEYAVLDTKIKATKSSLTAYNKELIANDANNKKLLETQNQLAIASSTLQANLDTAKQELDNIKNSSGVTDAELKNLRQSLINIGNVDPGTLPDTLQGLITRIQELAADATNVDAIRTAMEQLEVELKNGADGAQQFGEKFHSGITQSVEDTVRMNSEMDQLKSRLTYFFSAMNGIQLFKNAIRSAYESVKELDAAITEMAVVTDYSINDIWGNIPQYTKTATELGATTKDVINSMVLYTQQGLEMSQATELSTETMKMARIAGLEGAEATNLMTAALRGFNMELNETSAQRVNDVYSNLAANAAANTHEIADAMTRTASIANAAGMEFETTAAFLTQMIETTRESAENLGTAMKTIVARFTEMKKAPGDIIEVEGEEISVNKVEAALKSVGVQLRDTQGEFRDLDDVFLELSSKWDSLDVMSQRYVATMAAGSRQQSRFIAMMSNYQRTMELTGYATNSAGASQKQFEKTMDSLESKLNRLHDAWEQYVTGIANQSIIKGIVDLLTELLTTINKVTDALDPFHTGWSKILAAFLGFKAAKGVVNGVLKGIGTQLGTRSKTDLDEKQGAIDGSKYGKGFWGAFKKTKAQLQAQKQPGAMPLTEKTKSAKEAMKAQGMSTKKFTLTGKDTKAAKVFREQSGAMKEQNKALNDLSKGYSDYSVQLSGVEKSNKAFRTSTQTSRQKLIEMEKAYQQMDGVSEEEIANSQKRVACLESEANTIGRNTGATKLQTSANEMSTLAKETDTAATAANTSAKEADTVATTLEGEAIDAENIKQQASNMTKAQAFLALFSLDKEKRLAAAVTLGLATTEEVEAMATEGAAGAQSMFNAALYACPIMWIVAALAALVALIVVFTSITNAAAEAQEKKYKSAMEGAAEATEDATQKAEEAHQAYQDLLENKNTYNQLREELRSLVQGSDEYISKLQETRKLINDLVTNDPDLAKYVTVDENGITTMSAEGWRVAEQKKRESEYLAQMQVSANSLATTLDTAIDDLSLTGEGVEFTLQYNGNKYDATDSFTFGSYSPVGGGQTGQTYTYDAHGGDNVGLTEDYWKKVLEYANDLKITTEKTEGYTAVSGKNSLGQDVIYYVDPEVYNELSNSHLETKYAGSKGMDIQGIAPGSTNPMITNSNIQLTDQTLVSAFSAVFDPLTDKGMSVLDNYSKNVEGNFRSALGTALTQPKEGTTTDLAWASAFANFYSGQILKQNNPVALTRDIEEKVQNYITKDLDELINIYKGIDANFNEKNLDELSKNEDGDTDEDKKKGYLAKKIANAQGFSTIINDAVNIYDDLMKNHHDTFINALTVGSKKIDENIDDDLLNALVTYEDAGQYFQNLSDKGQEFLAVLDKMDMDAADFETYWDDARNYVQTAFKKTFDAFYDDDFINKLSAQDPSKDWKQEIQNRLITGMGKKTAFAMGDLFEKWETQAKEMGSELNTSLMFSSLWDSEILSNADEAYALYERMAEINFSNPVRAAEKINELANDSNESYAEWGKTLKRSSNEIVSAAKQAKYIYNSIDNDTMSDLFEDGAITRDEINELTATLPDLQTMLDANSLSASTLATYFTKVHDGMLNINTTSTDFLIALDKINKATNLITDSLEYISSFSVSESQQTITDSFIDWREAMETSLERGQYGDQSLIDYSKAILGTENWNKYYTEFNGNLQKVEELAFEKISLWKDNFYGLWSSFAGQSDIVSVGSGGEINFDLSKISSIDELKQALMDTFNISEEVAEAAIVDAQTYSSTLTEQLNNLSLDDSIKTLLDSSYVEGNLIKVSKNEVSILAEQAGMTTQELINFINKNLKSGYKLDFGNVVDEATGQLTEEFKQKYLERLNKVKLTGTELENAIKKDENFQNDGFYTTTTKTSSVDKNKNYKVYQRDLNALYSDFISQGLEPTEAKKQVQELLKSIFTDDKKDKVFFYIQDGIVNAVSKAANESTEELAKRLGIPQTQLYNSVDDAVSDGALDGLTDPAVDAQKKIDAINTTKETATAIAVGMAVGEKLGAGEAIGAWASSLYTSTRDSLDAAFSADIDKYQKIIDDANANKGGNLYEGNSNNNGGYGSSYTDSDSQYGWNDDDDDGDSDSDSDWTNDYDQYYNTLKKIEALERKRTELEKQQSRLTKQRFIDEEKLKANKKEQIALLKQQAQINSDLADTAASYLRGDSNGDVWFDEATGTIQTNPNAANYNEEQMDAFEEQKSLMEDHYETWKEAKDNLEDIYDAIDELTEVAEFSLEDLTDSVDRAIEVLDNTLTNLDREITRLDRYNSGATSSDYKKRYEQSAQTYADKYNQLTQKKAINEQKFNGQIHSDYGKYITYDWDSKEVTKSALYYTITDPETKESVDSFIEETQEIASNIIDMDNQQEEIKDSLYELQQTLADKSLEFQEKVYDAVVKSREDAITTLNNIDNSIKNAASDLISSVQKNLQKIRQDRQNQDKEEELQDMEAKLAYYQVDTSNANQKNILDLQKQLEDKQRSYTDTLIDQKISELQQQNDDAAAQRKKQIEIMETQLDLDKENGVIWKAVDDAIRTGFNSSGRIQKGSDLYNMLSSLDEVTKKNSVQFERWFGELSNLAAAYNANLTANLDTEGQMSDTVSNSNDVYGENSEYIKSLKNRLEEMNRDGNFNNLMWYDQKGQKMVYKYSYYHASSQTEADAYNKKVAEYTALAKELANARAYYKANKNASFTSAFKRMYGFDTGGLADYTGPAWLDGTPASPEMVLSSRDTENFIQLKDILSNVMNGEINDSDGSNGDCYFEIQINVDKVTSDYDVDQIADRIKQQITNDARYRNVNTINMIR